MFYYKNLNELVLKKVIQRNGISIEADEIIIVSGYISAYPILKLLDLGFDRVSVFGGMYNQGIYKNEYDDLLMLSSNNSKINIFFTEKQIHSKVYVWKKNGEVIFVLMGSANLTKSGLNINHRECLTELGSAYYPELSTYLDYIERVKVEIKDINKSLLVDRMNVDENTEEVFIYSAKKLESYSSANRSISLPLHTKKKIVEEKSGLNWGFSKKAKNKIDDAYIAVSTDKIEQNIAFFEPFIVNSKEGNRIIKVIWDDGVKMNLKFEGTQSVGSFVYPKQVSSFLADRSELDSEGNRQSAKSILGRYLRKRINIESGKTATYAMLENYGRTSIELSHIKGNLYFADFSV